MKSAEQEQSAATRTCSPPWAPSRRLRIMRLLLSAHPDGTGGRRDPGGTGPYRLEPLASPREAEERGAGSGGRAKGRFLRYTANTESLRELLSFLYAECCTRSKAIPPESESSLREIGGNMSEQDIKEVVKEKYGQAALRVATGGSSLLRRRAGRRSTAPTRSPATCTMPRRSGQLPETAVLASLGCGNPTALAELKAGRSRARSRLGRRASTCCFRRGGSGPRARPTVWT